MGILETCHRAGGGGKDLRNPQRRLWFQGCLGREWPVWAFLRAPEGVVFHLGTGHPRDPPLNGPVSPGELRPLDFSLPWRRVSGF